MSTVEVSFFNGFAFVVFFLAFSESDDEFYVAGATEKLNGDDSEAGGFFFFERCDLFFGREEAEISGGVGTKSEIVKPKLVIFDCDERTFELDVVVADFADLFAG